MRTDRLEAIQLRLTGRSYSYISKELGVAKSTLASWFKDVQWSKDVASLNHKSSYSIEKLARMKECRENALSNRYEAEKDIALAIFDQFHEEALFIAGVSQLSSEDFNSRSNGCIKICSSNYQNILIFKRFLETYFPIDFLRIKLILIINQKSDPQRILNWWSERLGIAPELFQKPIITTIQGGARLLYGSLSIIITSKSFNVRIRELIRLQNDYLLERV